MEKKIYCEDIGLVTLVASPRAIHYSLKISRGAVRATMPEGGSEARLMAFIQKNKEKILAALKKHPATAPLDDNHPLETATFHWEICRAGRNNFLLERKEGLRRVYCPETANFEAEAVQALLKKILRGELRHEAEHLLPLRLKAWAEKLHFVYAGVKIRDLKSRWGCCNTSGNITLSLSLMLLPWHLIDYVLIHELCHTKVMNHGKDFKSLIVSVTDGKAPEWRKELKNYSTLR